MFSQEIDQITTNLIKDSSHSICHLADFPVTLSKFLMKQSPIPLAELDEEMIIFQLTRGRIAETYENTVSEKVANSENWAYVENMNEIAIDPNSKNMMMISSIVNSEEAEYFFSVRTSLPITIFINGELVCHTTSAAHIKPYSFLFSLKKGVNTLLIIREYSELSFEIINIRRELKVELSIKKRSFIEKDDQAGILNEFLEKHQEGYTVIPKTIFCPENKAAILLLPKYFHNNRQKFHSLTLTDTKGYSQIFEQKDGLFQEIYLDKFAFGPIKLSMGESGELYVFKGDEASLQPLVSELRAFIEGQSIHLSSLEKLTEKYVLNYGMIELNYHKIHYIILKQLWSLLYIKNKQKILNLDICKEFGGLYSFEHTSSIDQEKNIYTIIFPKNKVVAANLMVVFLYPYGTLVDAYPDIPLGILQSEFENVVIVCVYSRGGLNRDYLSEYENVEIMSSVLQKLKQYSTVFISGICSGALRAYDLGIRFPKIFDGILGVGGVIREEKGNDWSKIQNLAFTPTVNIVSVNDEFFNYPKAIDSLKKIESQTKMLEYTLFSHKEVAEYFYTGEAIKLLVESIDKKTSENNDIKWWPQYNLYKRAKHVKINEINNPLTKTFCLIKKIDKQLTIMTQNINRYAIYVDNGDREIRHVKMPGNPLLLDATAPYFQISVSQEKVVIKELSKSEYVKLTGYAETLTFAKQQLGMKKRYLTACTLFRPKQKLFENSKLDRQFLRKIRCPLREKARHYYQMDVVQTDQPATEISNGSNRIILMEADAKQRVFVEEYMSQKDKQKSVLLKEGNWFYIENEYNSTTIVLGGEKGLKNCYELLDTFETNTLFLLNFFIYFEDKIYFLDGK